MAKRTNRVAWGLVVVLADGLLAGVGLPHVGNVELEVRMKEATDACWRPGWEDVDPVAAARSPNPTSDPVIFALAEACRYDIWDRSVMVQSLWSRTLDWTVLLWPRIEAQSKKPQPESDWKIEVSIPWVQNAKPRITTGGTLKSLPATSARAALGKAVMAASKQLAYLRGTRLSPVIIHVRETERGYWVSYKRLPLTPGAHTSVELSKDLKRYRISPGR